MQDTDKLLHSLNERFRIEVGEPLRRKIHLLTEGKPILMVLCLHRLQRGFNLPDLADLTSSQIRQGLSSKQREEFESALVDFFLNPSTDLDRLLLWMSYLNRRLDASIIEHLTGCSTDRSRQLFADLCLIPYVKPLGNTAVMHDEVAALVRKYVWERLDPFQTQRRELVDKIIDWLSAQIDVLDTGRGDIWSQINRVTEDVALSRPLQLSQNLGRQYKHERIAYALPFYPSKAIEYFEQAYQSEKDPNYRNELCTLIDRDPAYESLTPALQYEVLISRIRNFRDSGQLSEAQTGLGRLFEWRSVGRLSADQEIDFLTVQADVARRAGDLIKAIDWIEKAIDRAGNVTRSQESKLKQTLGLYLRQVGRLDRAEKLYEEALQSMPGDTTPDRLERAAIMTNLAFLLGQRGNAISGFQWGLAALEERQSLGPPEDVAATRIVLGSLYWARGQYDAARREYDQATKLIDTKSSTELYA